MDEERAAELLRLALRKPIDDLDEEQRILDFMEFSIIRSPEYSRGHLAQRIAKDNLDKPDEWLGWVAASSDDPLAWKVCVALLEKLCEPGPERGRRWARLFLSPLLVWALDVAEGTRKEPRKRGRDPYVNNYRDIIIFTFVAAVRDVGLRPATTSSTGKSACHLVAERLNLSYQTVRNIWQDGKKRFSLD